VMMVRRIAFLDRDGVLTIPPENEGKWYAPQSLAELRFYEDAVVSVQRLRRAAYEVVIVTNQPDIASGLLTREVLDGIHDLVRNQRRIQAIHTCPHATEDSCLCRKPLAGLLLAESAVDPVDFASSWLVGDHESDIRAGRTAGCRTVFIDRGWSHEDGS